MTSVTAAVLMPLGALAQGADFVVTTLGIGTPTPVLDRMGTATLIKVADKKLHLGTGAGWGLILAHHTTPAEVGEVFAKVQL